MALKYVSLYQCRSQTGDGFWKLTYNSELTLDTLAESNTHLIVVLRDFNTKSKNWYINDKTISEGAKIEFVTSQYGLHQIINEPTHVLENSSSCVDIIFTTKLGSGFSYSSIITPKLPSSKYFPHLMNEKYRIMDKRNTELIRKAIHEFNWQRAFSNLNVNKRVFFQ